MIFDSDDENLSDLLMSYQIGPLAKTPNYQECPWTTILKSLTILERAARLGATYRVREYNPFRS